jgi:hypothetical protein
VREKNGGRGKTWTENITGERWKRERLICVEERIIKKKLK